MELKVSFDKNIISRVIVETFTGVKDLQAAIDLLSYGGGPPNQSEAGWILESLCTGLKEAMSITLV